MEGTALNEKTNSFIFNETKPISAAMYSRMGNNEPNKIEYNAGLYCRLSRDDGNISNLESHSISMQKEMLINYCNEHGFNITEVYVDDGFTGTNFNRPDFIRMLRDIQLGRINLVITKDLSRLGRDYIETGRYAEVYFPENGVRYIAISDNIDTAKDNNDIAPFKNILNEMYAKDISRKVKASRIIAMQQGKFMGSIPPYGYKRDIDNKHKLVIDEVPAKIVRRIFQMYSNNEAMRTIANILNSENVMTPQEYYYFSIGKDNPYKGNHKSWCSATITNILSNQVYIGDIVQNTKKRVSFKSKKMEKVHPSLWHISENQHEPIIDKAIFNEVQVRLKSKSKSRPKNTQLGNVSLFSGILYCKDCGSAMTFNSCIRRSGLKDEYYRCSRYIQHGKSACSTHRISLDLLSELVLNDIQKVTKLSLKDEKLLMNRLLKFNLSAAKKEKGDTLDRINKVEKRLDEIKNNKVSAFEKNCNGIISDDLLTSLITSYKREEMNLQFELATLQEQADKQASFHYDYEAELNNLRRFVDIAKLDRKTLTSLVKAIYVGECKKIDGLKTYDIHIQYKFMYCIHNEKKDTISANMVSTTR